MRVERGGVKKVVEYGGIAKRAVWGSPIGPCEFVLIAVAFTWIGMASFWAVPAPYTIDDFHYWAMIDAVYNKFSFFIDNGYDEYKTEAQRLLLLVPVGERLTVQYPGGWGIVAAPGYALDGLRGVMMLNAFAAVITLWAVWATANVLFGDRRLSVTAALIFAFCTYMVEYVFGIWPHAVATCSVALACLAAALAWRREGGAWPLVVGLAVGFGMNFRVDVLLLVPPIGLWLVGTLDRPFRAAALMVAGLLPGLLISTVINWLKFETLSPVSYGLTGGASVRHFADFLPLLVPGIAFTIALAFPRVRSFLYRPRIALVALGALLGCIAVGAVFNGAVMRILTGLWILVVDLQHLAVIDRASFGTSSAGFRVDPEGIMQLFGILKKSLFQSMPFLAVLLIILPCIIWGPRRAPIMLGVLVALGVILPFAPHAWHGGMSNNMRYFLHALPMLSVLTAACLCFIWKASDSGPVATVAVAVLTAIMAAGVLIAGGHLDGAFFQLQLPRLLSLLIAISCAFALAARRFRILFTRIAGIFVGIAMGLAFAISHFVDLSNSQSHKALNREGMRLMSVIPDNALLVTFAPNQLGLHLNRPPAVTLQADFRSPVLSQGIGPVIARAHVDNRPVVADGKRLADQIIDEGLGGDVTELARRQRGALYLIGRPD